MSKELHFQSAIETGQQIAQGRVSSVEVTRHHLDRIAGLDNLNAFITLTAELALEQAARADAEVAQGLHKGPLHGVPIALKDIYDLAGTPTTGGMSSRAAHRASGNATATQRLLDAGAVILGKTNLTEGVYAEHRERYGAPVNPWNADRWCGASSSGNGVGVAAGLFYIGLSSETGGSIRIPSAMNGVTGLKPSWGRVSRHGAFELAASLDHVGAIARSVADAAAMLGIIAGLDPADPTSSRLPVHDYLGEIDKSLKGMRIGLDLDFASTGVDPEHVVAMLAAVEVLKSAGAEIVDVTVPDSSAIIWDWFDVCAVQTALVHAETFPGMAGDFGDGLTALIERGQRLQGMDYERAIARRNNFRGGFEALFNQVDVVISPGMAFSAPTDAQMDAGSAETISGLHRFTCPFTMSGHPVVSMPAGVHSDGMPINMQLIGPMFMEGAIIRSGHAFQRETRFHKRHPH